jgi:hypothetical protein
MPHITVDDEQAEVILKSSSNLEIRDRQGRCIAYVTHGVTKEDIELAKQRLASDEPRFTTHEVLEYLRSLEPK